MRIMKLLAVTALLLWPGASADAITRYTATVIPGVERGSYGNIVPSYLGWYYAGQYSPRCGLNDLGQVAGQTRALVGGVEQRHAALWDPQDGLRDLAPGDPRRSLALDANDRGQVVVNVDISPLPHGQYDRSYYKAFLWQDGVMTELGALGGRESYAVKVNESGQVVGSSNTTSSPYPHAFLWDVSLGMRDLGGWNSLAYDINDLGQVVGGSADAQGYMRAFLWQDGVMTDILGGELEGRAFAINNRGQVAGIYYDHAANVSGAFVWDAQSGMRDLGSLSGGVTYPLAINNLGQIVGWDARYQHVDEPFIWEDGVMMNLSDLIEPGVAPRVSRALAINDRGQILADRGNGGLVLLTPIPEPSSLAALAFGLAPLGIAGLGRKRR